MNQSRAKKIRKIVFGKQSRHQVEYRVMGGILRCAGLRAIYHALKKSWRKDLQNGRKSSERNG